jgi:oxygen-independent coproporphyrinogen-3 oxidase
LIYATITSSDWNNQEEFGVGRLIFSGLRYMGVTMSYFAKYDVPAPRYTSYPTVPYWTDLPSGEEWLGCLTTALAEPSSSWSMYIHVPFCESLCTFCGCHKTITKNHSVELPYVNQVLREFQIYLENVPTLKTQPLRVLHLGGGTPTFLSPDHLQRLVESLLGNVKIGSSFEGSIEIDPRRAEKSQLQVLRGLGFNRVSLGVQDFNADVQRLINRLQSFEVTKRVFDWSRELGYESINLDLIYGLPGQNLGFIEKTVEATLLLRPDRIALYSFALVPWLKPQQRSFRDEDVPAGKEKRDLYEKARSMLLFGGYEEIGMDHFALKNDALAVASHSNRLHRNFMGYTDVQTDILLGLGVSSISETPTCFHQNEKLLPQYERSLALGHVPTMQGHKLSANDQRQRQQILQLMTNGSVDILQSQRGDLEIFLAEMIKDGLVEIDASQLKMTEAGKPFLRNACMALDTRMREKNLGAKIFSQSM